VQVYAADIDVDSLRVSINPRREQWIVLPSDRRITGHIAAPTREAAYAGLLAADPSVAPPRPTLRGGGATVDLDFASASGTDLFRLLADVTRTNIVLRTTPPEFTIRVRRAGAIGVMNEMVRVAGLVLDRPAPNVIVVRTPAQPTMPKLSARGPKVALDTRNIRAGHALALLAALERSPDAALDLSAAATAAACDGGERLTLRVRKVPRDGVRELVAALGDVSLRGPACSLAPVRPADSGQLELVAVASLGTKRMAVGMVGDRALLIDGADPAWDVGDSYVTYQSDAIDARHAHMYPPFGPLDATPDALDGARLALVVIDDNARPPDAKTRAVIEVGGDRHWVSGNADVPEGMHAIASVVAGVLALVRITPGMVELLDPDTRAPVKTLRLQAR
jgi:hypothetical protein